MKTVHTVARAGPALAIGHVSDLANNATEPQRAGHLGHVQLAQKDGS